MGKTFLKGLGWIVPVGLTIYIIYWSLALIEHIVEQALLVVLPEDYYVPGMGFLFFILATFAIGLLAKSSIVSPIVRFIERLMNSIPLVKTVYGPLRDFASYFDGSKSDKLGKPVIVSLDDSGSTSLVGFITERHPDLPLANSDEHIESGQYVLVYFPMSYQLGGFAVKVPEGRTQELDMSFEEAMRFVLTGGVSAKPQQVSAATQ